MTPVSRDTILHRVTIPFALIAVVTVPCVTVAWFAGWL